MIGGRGSEKLTLILLILGGALIFVLYSDLKSKGIFGFLWDLLFGDRPKEEEEDKKKVRGYKGSKSGDLSNDRSGIGLSDNPTSTAISTLPAHPVEDTVTPQGVVNFATGTALSFDERLPWENNRTRFDVIRALRNDILRIQTAGELAEGFPEVKQVGGVARYLMAQNRRLVRAQSEHVQANLVNKH